MLLKINLLSLVSLFLPLTNVYSNVTKMMKTESKIERERRSLLKELFISLVERIVMDKQLPSSPNIPTSGYKLRSCQHFQPRQGVKLPWDSPPWPDCKSQEWGPSCWRGTPHIQSHSWEQEVNGKLSFIHHLPDIHQTHRKLVLFIRAKPGPGGWCSGNVWGLTE